MPKTDAFTESTAHYISEMQKPWGKIFYQLIQFQLEKHLSDDIKTVLNVGCGFGVTDRFFAKSGRGVRGVDITPSLLEAATEWAERDGLSIAYQELNIEEADVSEIPGTYDMVVLHNVLEYLNDAESVIDKLAHWTKQGGLLSLMFHNIEAKVFKAFYWNEDPAAALEKLGSPDYYAPTIGTTATQYTLEQVSDWLEQAGFELVASYGVRCLYDYHHTDKKFDPEWHEQALALEKAVCERSPYRDIGSFRHLIVRKR